MSQSVFDLANEAAETDDQSVTPESGGFDYVPPVEGVTLLRFVEYIEIGAQPQKPYLNKPKPDCLEAFLGFELHHPKHIQTYTDAEGKEVKTAPLVRIKLAVKTGDKARFKKLFNKMAYGRDIKHMAQMLGESFIADVHHYKPDDKRVYVNLDKDGEWSLRAPSHTDPITEAVTIIPVPAAERPLRIFLWKRATIETWDALRIDGTRTVKDANGVESEVSKNWLQELILKAKDFAGSALEALLHNLGGLSIEAQDPLAVTGAKATENPVTTAPSEQITTLTTASPSEAATAAIAATAPVETPVATPADAMALLGLTS